LARRVSAARMVMGYSFYMVYAIGKVEQTLKDLTVRRKSKIEAEG
jgi:hypothetical protein